jgi:hypothetical protein
LSKSSKTEDADLKNVARIKQLLGRRQSGIVIIEDKPVRVKCTGYGQLARCDNDAGVNLFLARPEERRPTISDEAVMTDYGFVSQSEADPLEMQRVVAE